jgi:hypothetical protein
MDEGYTAPPGGFTMPPLPSVSQPSTSQPSAPQPGTFGGEQIGATGPQPQMYGPPDYAFGPPAGVEAPGIDVSGVDRRPSQPPGSEVLSDWVAEVPGYQGSWRPPSARPDGPGTGMGAPGQQAGSGPLTTPMRGMDIAADPGPPPPTYPPPAFSSPEAGPGGTSPGHGSPWAPPPSFTDRGIGGGYLDARRAPDQSFGTGPMPTADQSFGTSPMPIPGQSFGTGPQFTPDQQFSTGPMPAADQPFNTGPQYGTGQPFVTGPQFTGGQQFATDQQFAAGHQFGTGQPFTTEQPFMSGPLPVPGEPLTGGPPIPGQPFAVGGGSPRKPRGSRGGKILAVGAGLTAILVAAVAIILLGHHAGVGHGTQGGAANGPTATTTASQAQPVSKIADVRTDPAPITEAEIFPDSKIAVAGSQFTRVAIGIDRNCALGARGAFARALKSAGCNKLVRATYVDRAKRFAVTAGVAALPTTALAMQADSAKVLKRNVWFAGLDGGPGSGGQHVAQTGGYAYSFVYGRYIIFAYATYSNGQTPTGSGAQDHVVNSLSRAFALLAAKPITARAANG